MTYNNPSRAAQRRIFQANFENGEKYVSQSLFDEGLCVRREVMGDEFVDRALAGADDFTMPLQQLVTENCWGTVWPREGLDRKTRSLVTVATLVALKASNELKGHVRGALRNGATVEEIQEVLLHTTVYCGMPAGLEAFRAAKEAVDAWQAEQGE